MTPILTLVALLCYGLLLLAVGRWRAHRAQGEAFFTAGRQARWYTVWPAMVSAAMSGITFVSVPASVAADGFTYLQMVAGFTVGQLIVAYWLVPLFYRLQLTSIYEYFDRRYGTATHRTGGWVFLLSKLAAASLKLSIVCVVIQQLLFAHFGVPYWANVLLTMVVVWGYTRRGGVGAVIRADWLKTAAMVGALVATIAAICEAMGWSAGEAWREVTSSPMARVFSFDDPASDRYFWKMFVAGILLLVAMTGLDQELMQRNLACRSVRDAQRTILWTAISQAVVIAAFLGLGVLLYRYAEATKMTLPERADQLFAAVAVEGGLPHWVGVLFVVGFAAGSFSSGGSALTALTTSILLDLKGCKQVDENELERDKKRTHALLAGAMAALVLCFGYGADEHIINLIYRVAGYTYGPILGLFLFGEWTRCRVRDGRVWIVVLAAPILSAAVQSVAMRYLNYSVGFELLLLNALLTMIGLWLIRQRTTA